MFKTRFVVAVMLMAVLAASGFAVRPTYKAGKTSGDLTISSTTVSFSITEIHFFTEGSYATILSSYSVLPGDQLTVTPNVPCEAKFSPAINMSGTGKAFKATLQSDTTLYYYIGGVVE